MMMFGFFPFFLLVFLFLLPSIERREAYNRRRRQLEAELYRQKVQERIGQKKRITKADYEKQVFALASKLDGRLLLSDVVLETGLGLKESEKLMDEIADGLHVKTEVDGRGFLFYEFPELQNRNTRNI